MNIPVVLHCCIFLAVKESFRTFIGVCNVHFVRAEKQLKAASGTAVALVMSVDCALKRTCDCRCLVRASFALLFCPRIVAAKY